MVYLLQHYFGRQAAAFSADLRDHTVRAVRVATVLNFERGASVISFGSNTGELESGLRSNVTDQDLCRRLPQRGGRKLQGKNGNEIFGSRREGQIFDDAGQFWLVRIPYYPGHARKLGHFFGGTLSVAAGDNHTRGMILRADFSDGVSGLRVRSGGNGAGVYDHDIGRPFGRSGVAALQQLHFKRGAIGLRGATSKLLNVKSRHDFEFTAR